jgi:hypothetical protein
MVLIEGDHSRKLIDTYARHRERARASFLKTGIGSFGANDTGEMVSAQIDRIDLEIMDFDKRRVRRRLPKFAVSAGLEKYRI